jgi:uncharacterized protein (TIGR04255 family)
MSEYLPFAGKNAIVEMSVGIQFQSQFDSQIGENIAAIKNDFAEDFPKFDPVQMQQFTLNVGISVPYSGPTGTPGLSGFVLTKLKSDLSPARVLRVMGNTISIHFLQYDSWQQTKTLAENYFDRCLRLTGVVEKNAMTAVFMRYVDRFIFDGELRDARANLLFRENSKLLPLTIFESGGLWHSNSGWYESLFDEAKALNNLGVASVTQPTINITVDHVNVYSLPQAHNSLADLFKGTQSQRSLLDILDQQHLANTVILKSLLNEKMLDTIGLK